jgi:hypothetical protein
LALGRSIDLDAFVPLLRASKDAGTSGRVGIAECDISRQEARRGGDMIDADLDELADGWFRCLATMVFRQTAAMMFIAMSKPPGAIWYQGDGTSQVLAQDVKVKRGGYRPIVLDVPD